MKKVIALVLGLIMMILYYFFSFIGYTTSWFSSNHEWGDTSDNSNQITYVKLSSDTLIFDKGDVELDMFIGSYNINNSTDLSDYLKNFELAIYISNDRIFPAELKRNGYNYFGDIKEMESFDEMKFVRRVSHDEAYNSNCEFGYTSKKDFSGEITYNHKEKITIPEEFFNENNDKIYIFVIDYVPYYDLNEHEKDKGNCKIKMLDVAWVGIKYYLIGDKIVFSQIKGL